MKKIFTSFCALALVLVSAGAQSMQTTFLLDNNMYSYRINPAQPAEKGFVGFIINNVNLSAGSGIGVGNLLFERNGSLVTGFNKAVSYNDFIGKLKDVNSVVVDENLSLLNFGWWTKHNFFNNVEFNIRGTQSVSLPRDLFAMLKAGSREDPYNLRDLSTHDQIYAEVAYGLSKSFGDGKFSIGARLKFLVGLANFNTLSNNAAFTVNGQNIAYDADIQLRGAANIINIGTRESSQVPGREVLDFGNLTFNPKGLKPAGFGGAVDIGITFKPVSGLTVGLAVLDLGAVKWNYNIFGRATGSDSFQGLTVNGLKDAQSDVQKELDEALKKLQQLVEFEPEDGSSSAVEMMPFTVNASVRYNMPFYQRLSVGVLGTYRPYIYNKLWEVRGGVTVTPIDWFSVTANYGLNNYGPTFGAAMSLNFLTFNLFAGVEGYSGRLGRFTAGNIPVPFPVGKFRYNLNLGLTITFGERHPQYKPTKHLWATGRYAKDVIL